MKKLDLEIELSPHNSIEAFAAYVNHSARTGKPKIVINFRSTVMACAEHDLHFIDFISESTVHEMIHAFQDLFKKAFDEDEVEEAIMAGRNYLEKRKK